MMENLDEALVIELDPEQRARLLALRSKSLGKLGRMQECYETGCKAVECCPTLVDGYFARGSALYIFGDYRRAMLDFERCLRLNGDCPKLQQALCLCKEKKEETSQALTKMAIDSKSGIVLPLNSLDVLMPPCFGWVVNGRIAASSAPTTQEQITAGFESLGIALAISLSSNNSSSTQVSWLTIPHVQVAMSRDPRFEQVDAVMDLMEGERDSGAVLIYCDDGIEWTGTVLACVVSKLMKIRDADEAMSCVRRIRPTKFNERFIRDYISAIWSEKTTDGRYPSTPHLPFSPEVHDDDCLMPATDLGVFVGTEIVITEKLDGGNCCIKHGKVYARTHNQPATHESFGPVKDLTQAFMHLIPDNIYLFGENMTGIHSIEYSNLQSCFYLFGVQKMGSSGVSMWLSWDQVEAWGERLGIMTVPVVFRGNITSMNELQRIMERQAKIESRVSAASGVRPEGFVVRIAREFQHSEFEKSMAKFVRAGHVQTDSTWLRTWKQAKILQN